ncbi:TetR/AcrR family transcriptional regulator [Lactobacillus delbrueckii subsp. indicus]|uniref:TetR/AcrR family transcriptional regulator n=1 Tax=Lactobacillus delbrueckii TaxID=1584 RepID=UPI00222317EF|nr:TetR/AcrR family transcriptional regulator [Lactobacillus delbrueckii]UYX13639.1 TetR/AcrR family transcriptional regulator [Lactobacillus delbrueckii]UYY85453.1 TetR/AcrR family transcriptional regulator [Lactobacillus delbrueckii subsp. indicus]
MPKRSRKTASKAKIRQALIDLVPAVGFQQLTISQLCQEAGINRGTFYLNYLDKEDLLRQTEADFFAGIQELLKGSGRRESAELFSKESILRLLDYVKENEDLVMVFFKSDLVQRTEYRLQEVMADVFASRQANLVHPAIKQPYASRLVFGGLATIFTLWVQRGMQESPEEISQILDQYRRMSPEEIIK